MTLSLTSIDSSFSALFLGYFFFSLVYERTIPYNDIRGFTHFSLPCVLQILRNDICEDPIMECANTSTHHCLNKQKLLISFTVASHVHCSLPRNSTTHNHVCAFANYLFFHFPTLFCQN